MRSKRDDTVCDTERFKLLEAVGIYGLLSQKGKNIHRKNDVAIEKR